MAEDVSDTAHQHLSHILSTTVAWLLKHTMCPSRPMLVAPPEWIASTASKFTGGLLAWNSWRRDWHSKLIRIIGSENILCTVCMTRCIIFVLVFSFLSNIWEKTWRELGKLFLPVIMNVITLVNFKWNLYLHLDLATKWGKKAGKQSLASTQTLWQLQVYC